MKSIKNSLIKNILYGRMLNYYFYIKSQNNQKLEIPDNPLYNSKYSKEIKEAVTLIFDKHKKEVLKECPKIEFVEYCIAKYGVDLVIEAINNSLRIFPGKRAFYEGGQFASNLFKIIETCDAQDAMSCTGIVSENVKFIPITCVQEALKTFHHILDLER